MPHPTWCGQTHLHIRLAAYHCTQDCEHKWRMYIFDFIDVWTHKLVSTSRKYGSYGMTKIGHSGCSKYEQSSSAIV